VKSEKDVVHIILVDHSDEKPIKSGKVRELQSGQGKVRKK